MAWGPDLALHIIPGSLKLGIHCAIFFNRSIQLPLKLFEKIAGVKSLRLTIHILTLYYAKRSYDLTAHSSEINTFRTSKTGTQQLFLWSNCSFSFTLVAMVSVYFSFSVRIRGIVSWLCFNCANTLKRVNRISNRFNFHLIDQEVVMRGW